MYRVHYTPPSVKTSALSACPHTPVVQDCGEERGYPKGTVSPRESEGDTGQAGTASRSPHGHPVKKGQDAQLDKIHSAVHLRGKWGNKAGREGKHVLGFGKYLGFRGNTASTC